MQAKFNLRCEPGRLRRQFGLADQAEPTWIDSESFTPGSLVVTIEWNVRGKPTLQMARFGFKMREGVLRMTNHRLESINPDAPSRAFLEGRCLVPVDVFHERGVDRNGHARQLSYRARDGRMLGLAAMLRPEAGGLSVTILTVPARTVVKSTNGRMPAIIGEDEYDTWLDDTSPLSTVLRMPLTDHDALLVET